MCLLVPTVEKPDRMMIVMPTLTAILDIMMIKINEQMIYNNEGIIKKYFYENMKKSLVILFRCLMEASINIFFLLL